MFPSDSDIDDSFFTLEYEDSVPPLSRAAKQGDLEKIRELFSKGRLAHACDNRGWTAVHCCVAYNQVEALKLILRLQEGSERHLANLTTWENVTPLHVALKASPPSLEVVKILLEAGASPNASTFTKLSPLHLACTRKGNIELVKLLVHYGANVNHQEDFSKFTPLHFAVCEARDLDIIKFVTRKCNLKLKNAYGRTPFLEACNGNFLEAVKYFLNLDKSLANAQAAIPPLVYACAWGNLEMAQLLLELGADVNQKCKAIITHGSEQILFDEPAFLPIHSSLTNVEIFKMLLNLTNQNEILDTDMCFSNFPIFVTIHSKETSCIEAFHQVDLCDGLKRISCQVLTSFVLCYPEWLDKIVQRFPLFFKYNFHLEPEDVFQGFVCQLSKEELWDTLKILHVLARMGISSADQFQNKKSLMRFLTEWGAGERAGELVSSTIELLSPPVLTLKKLARVVVRHQIRNLATSDWMAVQMVKESGLPKCLKDFLLFDSFV